MWEKKRVSCQHYPEQHLWAQWYLEETSTRWKWELWLCTRDEMDYPHSYKQQVPNPGSVMTWGCLSACEKDNLHFCDWLHLFQRHVQLFWFFFSTWQCKTIFCTQDKARAEEVQVLNFPDRSSHNRERGQCETNNKTTTTPTLLYTLKYLIAPYPQCQNIVQVLREGITI